jgi:hypothetical protein
MKKQQAAIERPRARTVAPGTDVQAANVSRQVECKLSLDATRRCLVRENRRPSGCRIVAVCRSFEIFF